MANTTHGYPYPLGTDRVMDGDDVIHGLASAVDTQLGVAASGSVAVTVTALSTAGTTAVTFPVGRFNVAPNVICTPNAGNSHQWTSGASSVTTGGCNINLSRIAGAVPATQNVYWIAQVI